MKKQIDELTAKLKQANYDYFVLENPILSDNEYDLLLRELKELEKLHPQLAAIDSPTKTVGSVVIDSFEKVEHKTPMLSLDNIFSGEEFYQFDEKVKQSLGSSEYSYVCEVKIDGLAMSLTYDNKLSVAATRGDGKIGENVTHNIQTIRSLPQTIDYDDFEVRGEVFISKENFNKINEKSSKKYANPRNLASGSVRQLDSKIAKERRLDMYAYGLVDPLKYGHTTYAQSMEFLSELGFKTNTKLRVCTSPQEVISYIEELSLKRDQLKYEIDGIVIKVNEYEHQQKLGFTSKYPKWAIAYKFASQVAVTKLEDIFITVGRTGKITPNAKLTPVSLMGSTIARATLHNFEYIAQKDIRVGDMVEIIKAGDIIPRVEKALIAKRSNESERYIPLAACPICNQELIVINQDQYCDNYYCSAKEIERIIYFASKDAMNIEGLGTGLIEKLYEEQIISHFTHLYELDYKRVKQLDKLGEKSVNNMKVSIENSLQTKLYRFITGLGIKGVGSEVAKLICNTYDTIEQIIELTEEQLVIIEGIGPILANNIVTFFSHEQNIDDINFMLEKGLVFDDAEIELIKNQYSGKSIVVTGTFDVMKRDEIKALFATFGASVKGSVSKNTDYLIAGDKAGSKLTKAQELGITIIDEEQLVKIINDKE